jgi:hypothetical protein
MDTATQTQLDMLRAMRAALAAKTPRDPSRSGVKAGSAAASQQRRIARIDASIARIETRQGA